jgi:hypothetical protein
MDDNTLLFRFKSASERLAKVTGKAAEGVEKEYGHAYQALVRAGLRQQLKKKYR